MAGVMQRSACVSDQRGADSLSAMRGMQVDRFDLAPGRVLVGVACRAIGDPARWRVLREGECDTRPPRIERIAPGGGALFDRQRGEERRGHDARVGRLPRCDVDVGDDRRVGGRGGADIDRRIRCHAHSATNMARKRVPRREAIRGTTPVQRLLPELRRHAPGARAFALAFAQERQARLRRVDRALEVHEVAVVARFAAAVVALLHPRELARLQLRLLVAAQVLAHTAVLIVQFAVELRELVAAAVHLIKRAARFPAPGRLRGKRNGKREQRKGCKQILFLHGGAPLGENR
ncbi:hypothetical protein EMIT0158MI4_20373 [Burkholderia ambifaria]